jgi:hypothetical protein
MEQLTLSQRDTALPRLLARSRSPTAKEIWQLTRMELVAKHPKRRGCVAEPVRDFR